MTEALSLAPPQKDKEDKMDSPEPEMGERVVKIAGYFNSDYYACAIVAVITTGIDWAAYINGCDVWVPEVVCAANVADFGVKLSEHDARHFFPDIDLPYRR